MPFHREWSAQANVGGPSLNVQAPSCLQHMRTAARGNSAASITWLPWQPTHPTNSAATVAIVQLTQHSVTGNGATVSTCNNFKVTTHVRAVAVSIDPAAARTLTIVSAGADLAIEQRISHLLSKCHVLVILLQNELRQTNNSESNSQKNHVRW